MRDEDDFITTRCQTDSDELVIFLKVDRDNPVLAVVAEIINGGFLHLAAAGGEEDIAGFLTEGDVVTILIDRSLKAEECRDFFLGFEVEHILNAAAHRGARAFREFVNSLHIHAAGVGEE